MKVEFDNNENLLLSKEDVQILKKEHKDIISKTKEIDNFEGMLLE